MARKETIRLTWHFLVLTAIGAPAAALYVYVYDIPIAAAGRELLGALIQLTIVLFMIYVVNRGYRLLQWRKKPPAEKCGLPIIDLSDQAEARALANIERAAQALDKLGPYQRGRSLRAEISQDAPLHPR